METHTPTVQEKSSPSKDLTTYADTLRDASFLFEEKIEELSLLKRIGTIVSYIFDQEAFYRKFLDILLEETNAENCSFMLLDDATNTLVLKMARGRNDDGTFFECTHPVATIFQLGEGVAGRTALEKEAVLINDVSKDTRFVRRETCYPIASLLCTPLIFQGKVLGVINLSHSKICAFSENNKRVMELLCAFVSAIIANAITYMSMRDKEKFHALFEGVQFALLLLDAESKKIIECNRYTEKLLGYSKKELLDMENVFTLLPSGYRETAQHFVHHIAGGTFLESQELPFIQKNGHIATVEANGTVVHYQEIKALLLTMKDMTEKKELEARLLQVEKLRSLGELAGGIAHDFNNILAAILGRVQLLHKCLAYPGREERRKSVGELTKGLEIIEKASLNGAEIVRRILEFSQKKDTATYGISVDVNTIIEEALNATKARWQQESDEQGILIKIHTRLSPLRWVKGNGAELKEVVINLIHNALDAMPQGGQLSITTFQEEHYIYIKVEDTGSGIPHTIMNRIFDPFFTTKGVQHSGLGLSVAYGIITRHGGTITVESSEGKGTIFIITLLLSEDAPDEITHVPLLPTKQKKGRILVIEDQEEVRELLKDILHNNGFEVATATNGSQGIAMCKKSDFDMVFTDLGMPEMSGWQVARELKKLHQDIPVALITGWEVPCLNEELTTSGVDFIIHKPFQMDQVVALVQKILACKEKGKKSTDQHLP